MEGLFNKWCWGKRTSTCKSVKVDLYFTWLTKCNLKWIKDLNERPEAIKFLDKNIEEKLLDIGLNNNFLYMTAKTQATK